MNEEKEKNFPKKENKKVAGKTATSFAGKKSSMPKTPLKKGSKNISKLLYNPHIRKNKPIPTPAKEIDSDAENEEKSPESNSEEKIKNKTLKSKKNNNDQSGVKVKTLLEGVATIKKIKIAIMILIPCVLILLFVILIGAIAGIVSSNDESSNSYCQVSGSGGTLISFITNWEGGESEEYSCDNGNGYVGYNIGDGTISIGSGMTNYAIGGATVGAYIEQNGWQNYFHVAGSSGGQTTYRVDVGLCVPKNVINSIKLFVIENNFAKPIDTYAEQYNVELTQFQKDALISFNYNVGSAYTEKLISAYASGGYSALWNAMKGHVNACINGNCGPLTGLMKRRKGEFALFVTGDYSDQGLFYSRSLDNYDDYNSEGVLNRRTVCGNPLSTNYTVATSTGSNDMLTEPLKDRLQKLGTSYQEYNEFILDSVIKAGVGTRAGVVAAAVSLVGGLYERYNIRIPYTWAGQHGGSIEGVSNPAEFYGVHPLWGTYINHYVHNSEVNRTYYYYGPDCSGFVGWALNNGGMVPHFSGMYNLGPNRTPTTNREGDPGDIVYLPGHYMLIVGVDDEAKKYYCAEAAGGDSGVRIKAYDFSNLGGGARIIDLDNFYNNPNQKKYTDAEAFATAFRAGELQY